MLKLQTSLFATDENGNEVFMMKGDTISEISDAGARELPSSEYTADYQAVGWNVTVRFTPSHRQWSELVVVDSIKLLKALEG